MPLREKIKSVYNYNFLIIYSLNEIPESVLLNANVFHFCNKRRGFHLGCNDPQNETNNSAAIHLISYFFVISLDNENNWNNEQQAVSHFIYVKVEEDISAEFI